MDNQRRKAKKQLKTPVVLLRCIFVVFKCSHGNRAVFSSSSRQKSKWKCFFSTTSTPESTESSKYPKTGLIETPIPNPRLFFVLWWFLCEFFGVSSRDSMSTWTSSWKMLKKGSTFPLLTLLRRELRYSRDQEPKEKHCGHFGAHFAEGRQHHDDQELRGHWSLRN